MLMEIAVGVIIVIGILGFIGYSYMIKQQSDEVRKLYEDFKKTYGKEYQIGFGLCKGTVFNKEYIVILAADKEKKVVDAVTAEGSGMEWTHGTASEYIGMDIAKYKKEQEEKKKIQKEWDSVNKRTKTIPKNQGTKKIPRCIPKKQRSRKKSISARKNQKIPGRCPCLT